MSETNRRAGRLLGYLGAAFIAFILAGCGTGQNATETDAPHNDQDELFAQQLALLNEKAVTMSELATQKGTSPLARQLAAGALRDRRTEIRTAGHLLESWGTALLRGGQDHAAVGGTIPGMASTGQLARLETASGLAFDQNYARLMLANGSGARILAAREVADGRNQQVRELAQNVLAQRTTQEPSWRQLISLVGRP